MRQIRKQILTLTNRYAFLLMIGLIAMIAPGITSAQDTGVVTHTLTGVAISGYDPVSYFTEPEPRMGLAEFEYEWSGVPWYFASAANRDAFIGAPEIYAPQFGGHCAMSLSRGYLSDGNPLNFMILGERLFLFYSLGNREAFALSPSNALAQAIAHWERLAPSALERLTVPGTDIDLAQ
jgi:YHS domain-containing protein